MSALMQSSSFLGHSLNRSLPIQQKPAQRAAPVQAFFKKAEKNIKQAGREIKKAAPANATQAVSKAKQAASQTQKKASKAEPREAKQAKSSGFNFFKKAEPKAKSAASKAAPKKPISKVKQALPKQPLQQAKKAVSQVKKALPKKPVQQAKKAAPRKPAQQFQTAAKSKGNQVARVGKGWLGGDNGPKGLDQWYGPSRALFLPRGLLDAEDIPDYLNGSLAGDYGYDPLGLGKDGQQVEKFRAYELIHARWAMLAAAGIIFPEGLQANGAAIKGGTWFETGAEMLDGGTLNYFAVPWGIVNNPIPLIAVTAIEVVLLGAVENYRRKESGPPGYSPGVGKFDSDIFDGVDNLYPGGPFDPLGLADDPETFQELKVKEIKNGRLAMVAVLAFGVQALVTGEGPYANWSKHVSDPFGYNLLTILNVEERLPTL